MSFKAVVSVIGTSDTWFFGIFYLDYSCRPMWSGSTS